MGLILNVANLGLARDAATVEVHSPHSDPSGPSYKGMDLPSPRLHDFTEVLSSTTPRNSQS